MSILPSHVVIAEVFCVYAPEITATDVCFEPEQRHTINSCYLKFVKAHVLVLTLRGTVAAYSH